MWAVALELSLPQSRDSTREYWMIYRGPGFLAVVWFGSCPIPFPSLPSVSSTKKTEKKKRQLADERVGRGWGRSQIIRRRESLVLNKSFNALWGSIIRSLLFIRNPIACVSILNTNKLYNIRNVCIIAPGTHYNPFTFNSIPQLFRLVWLGLPYILIIHMLMLTIMLMCLVFRRRVTSTCMDTSHYFHIRVALLKKTHLEAYSYFKNNNKHWINIHAFTVIMEPCARSLQNFLIYSKRKISTIFLTV